LHRKPNERYALQFHPVRNIPADSLPVLLVCLRPLYQQIKMAAAVAERFRCDGELCVLRMVGLAVFAVNCLYFILLLG